MLKIITETGSHYQVDTEGRQIRRVAGETPTTRIGEGEWRRYLELLPTTPVVGQHLMVIWDVLTEGAITRTTVTSQIVSVETAENV